MLVDLLDHVACPWCAAGGLEAQVAEGDGELIRRATLTCPACGRRSEVVDGIWHALGPCGSHRSPAQVLNQLPPTARLYERAWRRWSLSLLAGRRFPVPEELSELALWVRPFPGQVVVDVGCSEGLYARRLARDGAHVLAVDHALPFLRAAHRRAREEGVVVSPVLAVAQRLPVLGGAADAVVMGGSLNEVGDRPAAVAEIARVVRSGGRAFSMSLVPARGRVGRALQRALGPAGIAFDGPERTAAAFAAVGLRAAARRLDGVVLRLDLERTEPEVPERSRRPACPPTSAPKDASRPSEAL